MDVRPCRTSLKKIDESPAEEDPRQIVHPEAVISRKKQDIMDRLKQSVDPTDILVRHIAVVESSPKAFDEGEQGDLLADGRLPMRHVQSIENAKDHINLEALSLKMMKRAANLPICC